MKMKKEDTFNFDKSGRKETKSVSDKNEGNGTLYFQQDCE